jgi:UDP-N-acetylglucosamine 2-epimerase (non-hydrolysing)
MAEGIRKEYIFVVGSPMVEVIAANFEKIEASEVLAKLEVTQRKYIILSVHREENIDHSEHFYQLMEAVNALAANYQLPIIYSVHPRSAIFIKERKFKFHELVREMPPFPFTDYSRLMRDSYCVVSDSGTLPEEAAFHGFPAISLRTSTERPEALDKGCFIIGGITAETILQSVEMAVAMWKQGERSEIVPSYEISNVSMIVTRLIQSYTRIVDERIWRK